MKKFMMMPQPMMGKGLKNNFLEKEIILVFMCLESYKHQWLIFGKFGRLNFPCIKLENCGKLI